VNNQTRPGRDQIAESRFDVPPHWRWAWDGLFALYIPYAGDGWRIPNLAPGYGHLALKHEVAPTYSALGFDARGYAGRAACVFDDRLYQKQLETSRLSLLWAGRDPRATAVGTSYSGYFGINAGAIESNPFHLIGIERNGQARAVNVISATGGNAYAVCTNCAFPSDVAAPLAIAASRTYQESGAKSLSAKVNDTYAGYYGPGLFSAALGTDNWGYSSLSAPREIYMGHRYYGDTRDTGIITGIGALWFALHSYQQLQQLYAQPYAPFTKWKRLWGGTTIRTLRPTLDLVNSGWGIG
jgi:hypothetical protein